MAQAGVKDPDLTEQMMTPRRALAELGTIRLHKLNAGRHIELVDRPTKLQHEILAAFGVEAVEQGQNLLTWDDVKTVGETPMRRAPIYQGSRETPAELGSDVFTPHSLALVWRSRMMPGPMSRSIGIRSIDSCKENRGSEPPLGDPPSWTPNASIV